MSLWSDHWSEIVFSPRYMDWAGTGANSTLSDWAELCRVAHCVAACCSGAEEELTMLRSVCCVGACCSRTGDEMPMLRVARCVAT